jgi:hypothetical protein
MKVCRFWFTLIVLYLYHHVCTHCELDLSWLLGLLDKLDLSWLLGLLDTNFNDKIHD